MRLYIALSTATWLLITNHNHMENETMTIQAKLNHKDERFASYQITKTQYPDRLFMVQFILDDENGLSVWRVEVYIGGHKQDWASGSPDYVKNHSAERAIHGLLCWETEFANTIGREIDPRQDKSRCFVCDKPVEWGVWRCSECADSLTDYQAFRRLLECWWGDYDPMCSHQDLDELIKQFCDGYFLRDNNLYPLKHDTDVCKAGFEYRIADEKHELPKNPHN